MMEHDARLDQAGALQALQSPVDAVSGGDAPHYGTVADGSHVPFCSHWKRK